MNEKHCPSGKVYYPTKSEARATLGQIKRQNKKRKNNPRLETNYYWCPMCSGYHLTHTRIKQALAYKRKRDKRWRDYSFEEAAA
jgi:hypothetical protein